MSDEYNNYYTYDILNLCKVPILSEEGGMSFRREYDFEWHLDRTPTINYSVGATKSIIDSAVDIVKFVASFKDGGESINRMLGKAIGTGKKVAAYAIFTANILQFAELVSSRAESVQLPDDEIQMEKYKLGNTEVPVPSAKSMGNIQVTYIEDQYNNVYNFHKVWQECLRPGSDLCFMDVPSFSITGRYVTTGTKIDMHELDSLYQNKKSEDPGSVDELKKQYSQTVYPLIFPSLISRGTSSASSKNIAKVRVTYVRTPSIIKNPSVTKIDYATGLAKSWSVF